MTLDQSNTPSSASRIKASQVENAFPTPPRGITPDLPFRINGRLSPAPHKFFSLQRAQSTPPEVTDDTRFRSLTRGAGGDLPGISGSEQSWSRRELSKKKSQYYSEAFAYREASNTAKERVLKDSVIMAEVKMNCCLESEQEFLIDFSFQLSEIYQRPVSSIMVLVATDIAMLISSSCEPAYIVIVSALPCEIATTKNKRSAHLIQDFMEGAVQINPCRGVVRFEAVPEENLATNGTTALQEIEELERNSTDEDGILRALSRQKSRRSKKSGNPFSERGKTPTPVPRAITPSFLPFGTNRTKESKSTDASAPERKRIKRKSSNILAFFKSSPLPSPATYKVCSFQNASKLTGVSRAAPLQANTDPARPLLSLAFNNSLLGIKTPIQQLEFASRIIPYNQPQIYSERYRIASILASAGRYNAHYHPPSNINLTHAAIITNASITADVSNPTHLRPQGNDWQLSIPSYQGNFSTHYASAAYVALFGYQQLTTLQTLYPGYKSLGFTTSFTLSPNTSLLLTFSGKPRLRKPGFWSLTVYGADQYLIPNDLNRFEVGDRTYTLTYPDGGYVHGPKANASRDGMFQVLVQPKDVRPTGNWTGNWLPTEEVFTWITRWYVPEEALTDGGLCVSEGRNGGDYHRVI